MYLRVSLTDRCNLRCVYCLPADATFAAARVATSELQHLVHLIHHAVGVHKIRLTGGEPTLCDDLIDHVRYARTITPRVGLTTNGILLEPLLPALHEAGLNRLNISLDALDAESFRAFSRRDGLAKVIAAIRAARRLGFTPLKVNAVALPTTDYAALVRFAQWEGIHLRFIELMAIGEARPWHDAGFVSATEMRERIAKEGIALRETPELDEPTSRVWQIPGVDPHEASVGFITTMSAPFCATCDRLRLSAQGRLFTCLMDNRGLDIHRLWRESGDTAAITAIRAAVAGKRPPENFIRHDVMAAIGG